jgi:hypothetical protein
LGNIDEKGDRKKKPMKKKKKHTPRCKRVLLLRERGKGCAPRWPAMMGGFASV